jgi:hypothetical protein
MASVSDLRNSRFLKKTDIDTETPVTIQMVAEENVGDDENERMKLCLYFEELDKPLVLNVTNGELLEEITGYGTNIEKHWVGKKVVLYHDPNVRMKGKKVGGLRVKRVPDGESNDIF